MKLVTAIINKKDADDVCRTLRDEGFYFTKMATTGGFLTAGNTTLMIVTDDDSVEPALDIIRAHCKKRTEYVPSSTGTVNIALGPAQVVVGGATVFVTNVEHFEKI